MTCKYEWTVEWYSVLSKACHNCPMNITDCFSKDCVFANGVDRPIVTVNRQLPGPAIIACKGDLIIINLKNMLHFSEATSLHW